MNKENDTRSRILGESLQLFSIHGYKAVTVRMIGDAVGIRNSALYKHFAGKRGIFDEIVRRSREKFRERYRLLQLNHLSTEHVKETCLAMFHFQTHDPWISGFRRILVMEQFRDPAAAALYRDIFVDTPLQLQARLFAQLIQKNLMVERDPAVLAMELYAPFFMHHSFCDHSTDSIERLGRHVEYFLENNLMEIPGTPGKEEDEWNRES